MLIVTYFIGLFIVMPNPEIQECDPSMSQCLTESEHVVSPCYAHSLTTRTDD